MSKAGATGSMAPVSHSHPTDVTTNPSVHMAAATQVIHPIATQGITSIASQGITPIATQGVTTLATQGRTPLVSQAGPTAIEVTSLADHTNANITSTATTTSTVNPLPSGILFKGKRHRKRVSFRDNDLVNIREIPPRASSADEDSDDDDDDQSDSSNSDSNTDSDEEEEKQEATPTAVPVAVAPAKPQVAGGLQKDKAVTLTISKTSPSPPVSTLTVRPERAPIPWSNTHSYPVAKGSYNVSTCPASKVVSLVSHITGVPPSASRTPPRPRSCPPPTTTSAAIAASSSPSPTPKSASPTPGKKAAVVRVERKVKKITPTLDHVMTSQTVRSVQKHGAVTDSLHRASGSPKTGKKKRMLQKRQEGSDKRKASSARRAKDSKAVHKVSPITTSTTKQTATNKGVNGVTSGTKSRVGVKGLSTTRDSLSLPPLSTDDNVLPTPARLPPQPRSPPKSAVHITDAFLFPSDPATDLVPGIKVTASPQAMGGGEEVRQKPQGPPISTLMIGGAQVRDRVSSAPPSSAASRRKRFYAWHMANGNLQNSLHEPPCITPMWETVTPVTPPTPKPAFIADR